MSGIDEKLIGRNWRERNNQTTEDSEVGEDGGDDYRRNVQTARLRRHVEDIKNANGSTSKINASSQKTASMLRIAWRTLFSPSILLSLLYLNVHCFFAHLVGASSFCKFGEEWFPGPTAMLPSVQGKVRMIRMLEFMLLGFIDLLILLVILIFFAALMAIFDFAFGWLGILIGWVAKVVS